MTETCPMMSIINKTKLLVFNLEGQNEKVAQLQELV